MRVGTRSLLFGVHQVVWHPFTVLIAWWKLYGRPSWKEVVCIAIHDWGYWGKPNMDGAEGEKHPVLGATIALRLFGNGSGYAKMVLCHSRHLARQLGLEPSKLCWADKYSHCFDPWWFYIPRAWLSGELREYRQLTAKAGFIPLSASHRTWYRWIQDRFYRLAMERRGDAVPYVNPLRAAGKGG